MTPSTSDLSRRLREIQVSHPPALVHPTWRDRFPWLIQGTTVRGSGDGQFDLGLFSGGNPEAVVRRSWSLLRKATGAHAVIHGPQPHGADVMVHEEVGGDGPHLAEPADGHATAQPGVLLAVTVADCVPVFMVDERTRSVALLHAGWRGAASGIMERGVDVMCRAFGSDPSNLSVHLGPSICGSCYEVGPEVFEALGRPVPERPEPIDLRSLLAERARDLGIARARMTTSEHCTRCTASPLFSHRSGDAHRQAAFLGVVP